MFNLILVWLVTYFLHSTVLLGLAALLDQLGLLRNLKLSEMIWRIALCGGLGGCPEFCVN